MRRVHYLHFNEDVVRVKNKNSQIVVYSDDFILLERTWHNKNTEMFLDLHAKFDTNSMNGFQVSAQLIRNNKTLSSSISNVSVYIVNESNWNKTFISNISLSEISNGFYSGSINQASLGLNELSGREVYYLECECTRQRRKFKSHKYFNHLGCYDNIIRLRRDTERLESLKVDE